MQRSRVIRVALCLTALLLTTPKHVWAESPAPSDVLTRIMRSHAHLDQDDPCGLPMKVRSLLQDEYQFFRGTADLFYEDCRASTSEWVKHPEFFVVLHGDVHPGNVGTYPEVGPPGPVLGFGLVDFDETVEGPFQLDLLRAACALQVSARVNKVQLGTGELDQIFDRLIQGYHRAVTSPGGDSGMMEQSMVQRLLDKASRGSLPEYIEKFATVDPPRFSACRIKKGEVTDVMDPIDAATRERLEEALVYYGREGGDKTVRAAWVDAGAERWRAAVLDVVRWTRVGSSGSQGLDKYLVLVEWPAADEYGRVILELKEEPCPAAARAGLLSAECGAARGRAVARACATLRRKGEWLVGYTSLGEKGFLVRAKDPWSEEFDAADHVTPEAMAAVAEVMGWSIGQLHRIGMQRQGEGEVGLLCVEKAVLPFRATLAALSAQMVNANALRFRRLASDAAALAMAERANEFLRQRAVRAGEGSGSQ